MHYNVYNWLMFPRQKTVDGYALWTSYPMQNVPLHIDFKGRHLTGVADPLDKHLESGIPTAFVIYIGGKHLGTLRCEKEGWRMDKAVDQELVVHLGNYIHAWYE